MINKIKENIWQFHFNEFGSCVYLINHNDQLILIDTSSKGCANELLSDLNSINIKPAEIDSIILTHDHWDHRENVHLFSNAKIYSFNNLEKLIKDFPDFEIHKTPGHTKDSIVILYEDVLFSGDVIFDKDQNYIGRTDLPESVPEKMQGTLDFIKTLKYKILCPGHSV